MKAQNRMACLVYMKKRQGAWEMDDATRLSGDLSEPDKVSARQHPPGNHFLLHASGLVDEQISSFIFCPRGMDAPPRRRVRPWACRPLLGALTPVGVHTAMALRARRSKTWTALVLGTRAERPAKPTAALPTIRYALAEAEETCLFVH